jgi:hypothetical protein
MNWPNLTDVLAVYVEGGPDGLRVHSIILSFNACGFTDDSVHGTVITVIVCQDPGREVSLM